jgi:outer membrane protein, heavy metal efflux system
MKCILSFGTILGLACFSLHAETTLSTLTSEALARNPEVQAAKKIWQSKIKQARIDDAWEDPKLRVGSVLGRFVNIPQNGMLDQSAGIEQTLPISGKNRVQARMALASAETAFQTYRRQQLNIVEKVSRAAFELNGLNEQLKLTQEDITALNQIISVIHAKFEAGKSSQTEIDTAQIDRDQLEDTSNELAQKWIETETSLNVLLNLDPFAEPGNIRIDFHNNQTLDAESLRQLLLANNPEILQAQAALTISQLKLQLAHRNWIPDPTLGIQASHYNGGAQFTSDVSGSISFSLPWINSSKYHVIEDQARDEISAASGDLQSVTQTTIGKLRIQLQLLTTLHHHLMTYETRLAPAVTQSVTSSLADYQNNKISLSDILTILNNQRNLRATKASDEANYLTALAGLQALVGSHIASDRDRSVSPRLAERIHGCHSKRWDRNRERNRE